MGIDQASTIFVLLSEAIMISADKATTRSPFTMPEIWIKVDPWNKELVIAALEAGADAVVVPAGKSPRVKELGLILTVSEDGDLRWGRDVISLEVKSSVDEIEIISLCRHKKVVVRTTDWSIIPLENLVARTSNIWIEVRTLEQARTALGVLEKGVDGLIIEEPDPAKLHHIVAEIKGNRQDLSLSRLQITGLRPLAMGDRVCVDTCTVMEAGEGILVGNSSQALFLVHAESLENPYVAPRPFRVNAGPVHAYVLSPRGKTRYLSELRAGHEVLKVDAQGRATPVVVGRVKIERRPLILVEAQAVIGPVTTIVQNAETIRLVRPDGEPVSVVSLKPGDEVLAFLGNLGRHFGHPVEETITEK
jgi:3-dehydroquinate synthase II